MSYWIIAAFVVFIGLAVYRIKKTRERGDPPAGGGGAGNDGPPKPPR
jgi:hypothetical protein